MNLAKQVRIFGLSKIHTFEPNTSLIKLFSLVFKKNVFINLGFCLMVLKIKIKLLIFYTIYFFHT